MPDPRINNDADGEDWTPNLQFDSNKPMWNDEESEDDIDRENEWMYGEGSTGRF